MLTYLDTSVLIHAARGAGAHRDRAFAILSDTARTFASSVFLELELLPNSHGAQLGFYESYFKSVAVQATDLSAIVALARVEGIAHGIAAMDALHLAAAATVKAEFVTFEAATKPLFRSQATAVRSLHV